MKRLRRACLAAIWVWSTSGCRSIIGDEIWNETSNESSPPPEFEPPHPVAAKPTVAVALTDTPTTTPAQTRSAFSISKIRELSVYTIWSKLEGEHYEIRQFHMPSGDIYYQKMIPFSTQIDEPVAFTQQVAIPHASAIQPVEANERGDLIVADYLPLAGSWIGDHQITGTWSLAIYLDGAQHPSRVYDFELVP